MEMEDRLKSKRLYKIFLIMLKYIPIIIGICYMLSTIFSLIGINIAFFSVFSGMSILTLLFLLIVSFVFNFYLYHRVFLYYATTIDFINWIDYLYTIPITTYNLLVFECVLAGITILISIMSYVKHRKKLIGSNN